MIRGLCALALIAGPAWAEVPQGERNAPGLEPAFDGQTRAPEVKSAFGVRAEVFAPGLENPWGIATLPDGTYLVTERPGRIRLVAADGSVSDALTGVPEVFDQGQGGLLDVAVGPDFATDRRVYFTYSKPLGLQRSVTAAARGVLSDDGTALTDVEDIFVQEPFSLSPAHYGSRIAFDGEGHLFVTTGEHFTSRELAQDNGTTYGKVVRINPDGSVPQDNPLVGQDGIDTIWTSGHRNVQGAAIAPDGRLWTIEHGPLGGDELNLSRPGANYGWPVVSYGINYNGSDVGEGIAHAEGMEEPVYFWDPVIAPSGMTFYSGEMFPEWEGNLLIGGLASERLVRVVIEGDRVTGEERMLDVGRIRDVEVMADGSLLVLVDAADGAVMRVTRE